MIEDIKILSEVVPFVPFTIHLADGRGIRVPTSDHVSFDEVRVTVTHDDGSFDLLPGLLMTGIKLDAPPESSKAAE